MKVLAPTLNANPGTLQEQNKRVVASGDIRDIVKLTQVEYDALVTKNATTLYVIIG